MKRSLRFLSVLLAVCIAAACLTTASAYEVNGSVMIGINAASLDLAESIGIRFYVQASKLTSYTASYLEVAFDADRDGAAETITLRPEENTVTLSDSKAYNEYILKGVAPDNMGTSLTAQLFVVKNDGYAYTGGTRTYSVKDYILNVLSGADYDTRALLADLAAYGYAAEAYTGRASLPASGTEYDALTDLMATYGRTQTMADTSAANAKMVNYPTGVTAANAKVTFRTVGLNLRDNAGILYAFSPADGETISDYRIKIKKGDATYTYDSSAFTSEGSGVWSFRFREILPDEMTTPVTARFINGSDANVSAMLRYSVATYAYQCYLDRANNAALNDLTQAMMRYGDAVRKFKNGIVDWFDVDAAFAASGLTMSQDVSSCFPESCAHYVVNGGTASQPYLVDADTLFRLTEAEVIGSGYVKWKNHSYRTDFCGAEKAFPGVVPVSKLNDPIYMEMALPSDGQYYNCDYEMDYTGPIRYRKNSTTGEYEPNKLLYNNRKNGYNMVQPRSEHLNVIDMGAFFLNYDVAPPAQDAAITICVKDMKQYVHRKGDPADSWILIHERAVPTASAFTKVKIDWTGGNQNISSRYAAVGDHAEISLTGADLWTPDATYDWKLHPAYQSLIHFWDAQTTFASIGISDATDVDGIICSYVAWVKEPEMANKLVATVSADLRPGSLPEPYSAYASGGMTGYKNPDSPNSDVNQLLVSRAAHVTATPTVFVSHNVYPALYDEIVDTDYIQTLLGMK